MKIDRLVKTGKNKYKVYFDNSEVTLFEDVILNNDLLLKKDIDLELLDKVIEDNKYYEAYYLSLGYIDIKMRNKNEITKYLKKKDFSNKIIDFTITKLTNLGLLNDNKYIEAFINDKINLSNDGPYKIKRLLLDIDYKEEVIDEYLNKIDSSIWKDKISHIISKKTKSLKNNSYYMFINKMKSYLFDLGYETELIELELSKVNYDNSSIEKEYKKASIKYKTDKNKIYNYLLRKGYGYDEINSIINENE